MKIWEEEINAKGGLLGRPVKLVYYDDQTNPSTVPGIYTKLIDVDKVDIVVGGYATNMIAPAMPVVMQKNRTFIGLFALDGEPRVQVIRYFSIMPTGGRSPRRRSPRASSRWRWRRIRSRRRWPCRRRRRVLSQCLRGRAQQRQEVRLKIVYDRTYPPATTDYTPIVRAVAGGQRRHRLRLLLSAQLGWHRPRQQRDRLQAEDFGGGMVGLQATGIKTQLGPLNGIMDYETWVPWARC